MKPLEIFQRLLNRAFYDGHKRGRNDKGKPGELVTKLPPADREVLSNLTSDEVNSLRVEPQELMAAESFNYEFPEQKERPRKGRWGL